VNETTTLKINIPRGVEDGTQLRLLGEGEAGPPGGERGDLYILLSVKPHQRYRREGFDLHVDEAISFTLAALGGEVAIDTPWGEETLKVPAGTQPGQVFRIANRGVPRSDSDQAPRGSLHVHLTVRVPKHLTPRQREILREFAAEAG